MSYTTNRIERLNRDYKRVIRMRGAFPNPDATLLLLGRVAMSGKVYLRKAPKLNYEKEKFNWEEQMNIFANKGKTHTHFLGHYRLVRKLAK